MKRVDVFKRGRLATLIAFLALGLAAVPALPARAEDGVGITVTGKVTLFDDSQDPRPFALAQAKVCEGGPDYNCTMTGEDGRYTLTDVRGWAMGDTHVFYPTVYPVGEAQEEAFGDTKYGYGSHPSYIPIHPGVPLTGIDIHVNAYPLVSGTVVDTKRRPITGASIVEQVSESEVASTDASGAFSIRIHPLHGIADSYTFVVRKPGYKSWTSPAIFQATKTTVVLSQAKNPRKVVKPSAPISAGSVKIMGTKKVGKTLRAKVGRWSPVAVTLTYTWFRNGIRIDGANGKRYHLTAKDRGERIQVRVTGTYADQTVRVRSKRTHRVR